MIGTDKLSNYSKEAIDLVREFRLQASNTIVAEFNGEEIIEVDNSEQVHALAHAYDQAGAEEGLFTDLYDFDNILAELEKLESDPHSYDCERYRVFVGF